MLLLGGWGRLSPCCPPDDQPCPDHPLHYFVLWQGSFHLVDEDVGGLFAHLFAALFYRRQHRLAGYGPLTVREAADGNVLRHPVAHALAGIENADGRIVVDGEERIGRCAQTHDVGRDGLGIACRV